MSTQPNLLIISTDCLRYDALHCNGNALARTPRLDALAARGVRYSRAYCPQPICAPCRASVMTGQYPWVHGTWQNGFTLRDRPTLMPHVLARSGYQTHCYGKCHFRPWLSSLDPSEATAAQHPEYLGDGPYYGFERVRVVDHSSQDRYYDWVAEHFPQHLALAHDRASERPPGAKLGWKSSLPVEATKSRYIGELTIGALSELARSEQPFFMWASFDDPHHPYTPSAPYCDWYDDVDFPRPPSNEGPGPNLPRHYHDWVRRLAETWGHVDTAQTQYPQIRRMYQALVSQVDAEIGRVLDALDETGLAENTLIVFFSDHGTMLGDYGLMQVGEYSQEPLVRVPMIWRGPGVAAGAVCDGLASMVDIMPTMLDCCGVEPVLGVQGLSLRPQLADARHKLRRDLLINNRWGQSPPESFRTLVTDRYKLSVGTASGAGELYDLHTDPLEVNNLFGRAEAAPLQADLMRRMLVACLRDDNPFPVREACW